MRFFHPLFALTLLGLAWAARLLMIKSVSQTGLHPTISLGLVMAGVVGLLVFINLLRSNFPPIHHQAIKFYCITGLFGFGAPFLLELIVADELPVIVFVLIVTSAPLWTLGFALSLRLEHISIRKALGLISGFIAAVLIIAGGYETIDTDIHFGFLLLAFVIPMLYAGYILFVAQLWPGTADGLQVAQGQAMVTLPVFGLVGALFASEQPNMAPDFTQSFLLCAISVLEIIALLLYFQLAREQGGTYATQANYISVAAGAILGSIIFSEPLTYLTGCGLVLLVLSLWLAIPKAISQAAPNHPL